MNARQLNLISLCVAGAVLAACQRGQIPQAPAPSAAQRHDTYEFNVRSGDVRFEGMLYADNDTLRIQLRQGTCWTDIEAQQHPESTRFKCQGSMGVDGLTLTFDNRNPQRSSSWSGTILRQVTQRECTAWGLNEKGQPACVTMQSISKEVKVDVFGTILLQRKTPAS